MSRILTALFMLGVHAHAGIEVSRAVVPVFNDGTKLLVAEYVHETDVSRVVRSLQLSTGLKAKMATQQGRRALVNHYTYRLMVKTRPKVPLADIVRP